MNLWIEAHRANEYKIGNHFTHKWEVFRRVGDRFEYLGSLEGPAMCGYELWEEYGTKFKELFLEKMRAFCTINDLDEYSLKNEMCYREKQPFGTWPSESQMVYPFK